MNENMILLLSLVVGFSVSAVLFFLVRGRLRRTTWPKRASAIAGLFFLSIFIGSPVAFLLCRNFGLQVDPLVPHTASEEHKNQLGLYRDASQYDDGIAFGLAQAAALTYKDESEVRRKLVGLGFLESQVYYLSKESNVGVVIVDEETMVIAFRGTDDLQDWRTNFNIVPDPSAAWVHSGFKQALDTLWEDLISIVHRESKQRGIFITGHSLGGAIATLAAVRLESNGSHVTGLYTFGQPPVGGERFAERAKDLRYRYFRFINHVDMVADTLSGTLHTGEARYFNVFGELYAGKPLCQSLYDSAAAPGIEAGAEWLAHGVERYVELLNARR
jgi:triacylglycerol lipase